MEALDLSGEDEEYLSIEQLEKMEDIKKFSGTADTTSNREKGNRMKTTR